MVGAYIAVVQQWRISVVHYNRLLATFYLHLNTRLQQSWHLSLKMLQQERVDFSLITIPVLIIVFIILNAGVIGAVSPLLTLPHIFDEIPFGGKIC